LGIENINYAKLINPKAPWVCYVLITNVLCSGVNWTLFNAIMDVLMVSLRRRLTSFFK
jgi:hypothetical protein